MKVLVTGVSGFVGRQLLQQLADFEVIGLGRNKPNKDLPCDFYQAAIDGSTDYSPALKGVDVVIHLAARVHVMNDSASDPLESYREVNTYGTTNLARQAAQAGVKRFIFISSIKANGESTIIGKPFTAVDTVSPQDFYGISKAEAEQELFSVSKETNLEVVVIRPTLVYGPGVKANFASLMSLVSKGVPLPFGCIRENKRSLVSVDNLVDLIITCVRHPQAANQVFLVSDDNDISTSTMIQEMAKALGKPAWQVSVPVWFYKLIGWMCNKNNITDRLIGSLQVDISDTKNTLGWLPPQTLEEGFKQTADSFLQQKSDK